jgi:SAM-dependent methyltransferase
MKISEFEELTADPAARSSGYSSMLNGYYDLVSDIYGRAWGTSQHFAVYAAGDTDRQEAILNTEKRLSDTGGFTEGMSILDIGCGVGGPATTIAKHSGAHVTGIDLVPHRVAAAGSLAERLGCASNTHFIAGDAMQLPFPDSTFDGAYSFEALCHAPDKARAYREVARVLKPGARFLGQDWLRGEILTAEGARDVEEICRCHGLAHMSTLTQTRADLENAGFDIHTVTDAATQGDVARNWTLLRETVNKAKYVPDMVIPKVMKMMIRGGQALCDGGESGAFLIGYWDAQLPG